MPRFSRHATMVLAFLALQTVGVLWISGGERPPAMADLSQFPKTLGAWQWVLDEPLDASTQAQLGADRHFNATYNMTRTGMYANIFVAWFQSQRGGATQPHSPQVCLPGSGWVSEDTARVPLETSAGIIEINRYIVSKREERAVTLYWYQTPRRVIASEWAAKFWLVPDSIRDHRTDTSLVRIVLWNRGKSDDETVALARGLAAQVYPVLRQMLPR